MTQTESAKLVANIRLWSIRNYLHDLAQFYAGDEGRFTRMVVDGGKSLPSAYPGGWVQHITNLLPTVIEFYPGEVSGVVEQLQAWGHSIKRITDSE